MHEKIWEGIKRHIHSLGGFEKAVLIEVKPGYAKFSIDLTPEAINLYGIVHGGFLFTICDMAAGMATYAYEVKNTTAQASINFLRGIKPETKTLFVEAKTIHKGKSTAVNRVEVTTESGSLFVSASYTMFLLSPIICE